MTRQPDPDPQDASTLRTRDVATPTGETRRKGTGRNYIAVVGINRYRAWSALGNAVQDARGALEAFVRLGFQPACPPILDEAATLGALHRLVSDDLGALGTEDSLVIFFAGHGHNVVTTFGDGTLTKQGYLIPVDADLPPKQSATWVGLDSWLGSISRLPPKHILVILDACHSGIALDPVIRWRGEDVRLAEPLEVLRTRRSRRIITSALDNQRAQDGGPVEGHSLFTGCLIEALTGGLLAKTGQRITTGSSLGLHVQQRVTTFPSSQQTPDFGALQLDDRGELIIDLPGPEPTHGVATVWPRGKTANPSSPDASAARPSQPRLGGVDTIRPIRAHKPTAPVAPPVASSSAPTALEPTQVEPKVSVPVAQEPPPPVVPTAKPAGDVVPPRPRGPLLDQAFVAMLGRHDAARKRGGHVLTVVTADPMTAVTGWAMWAATRAQLTLVTDATGLDATIDALLAQMPWLRAVPAARAKLAAAASLAPDAVDAALDARSAPEREAWIDDVSRHDLHARVAGWLLSALREPWAQVPDLKTAPVQGGDLLTALCELATPISVLLHHAEPAAPWLEQALQTAFELVHFLPRHPIAVGAPSELVHRVVRSHSDSAAMALARHGVVPLASRTLRTDDPPRARAEQVLHAALARDPRTAGLFEANAQVPIHDSERAIVVDLVARNALLAVEIDDWYHFRDPQAYHRDRIKDVWLQRAGFFVMRFLVEDIETRLVQTVDEIATGLAGRRASGSFEEKAP